MKGQVWS